MEQLRFKRKILTILKFGILFLLIFIMAYVHLYQKNVTYIIRSPIEIKAYTLMFLHFAVCILYLFWILESIRINKNSRISKLRFTVESMTYIVINFFTIYLFQFYKENCKYIFLLLIVISIIKYGLKAGIINSCLFSFILIIEDIIHFQSYDAIYEFLEQDFITVIVYMFIALVLGYYVNNENKKYKEKDKEVNALNSELAMQSCKRKKIEIALLKNEVCYDILFENSINAIIIHESGRIIYANESAAKLLGYESHEDLNKKSLYNYYNSKNIEHIKTKYEKILTYGVSKFIEDEKICNTAGDIIEVRNTSSYFTYNGKPTVLTLILNITQEKELENLKKDRERELKLYNDTKEFNIMITEFFTNISHELKTPVNVIYAAVQTMELYLKNESIDKCKFYLKTMKQNSLRMIRLINNLMDITKVDYGFVKLKKSKADIVELVEDISNSIIDYIKTKNIELVFDTEVEEKIMSFDCDKIERIMLNLLSNAFKYSPAGGKIYVNILDNEDSIEIKVKDEGMGIPQDKLNLLFKRFGQVDRSLSRNSEGTGIGLYLVKSFAEMHGGKVTVSSQEGKGSEFTVTLPVVLESNSEDIDEELYKTNVERINIEFSDIYSLQIYT